MKRFVKGSILAVIFYIWYKDNTKVGVQFLIKEFPMRNSMRTGRLYMAMGGIFILLFAIAHVGTWTRTIGREPINIGGVETVIATVLNNRQVVYQQGITHTSVSEERGRLLTVSAVPGSTGLMIMRRNPTASEEQLWMKYFGVMSVTAPLQSVVLRAE